MRRERVVIAFVILFLAGAAKAAEEGPVWFWFATCSGPVMGIEVRFDKATIVKVAVPLCQADRGSADNQGQRVGKIRFSFRPTRAIVWEGYRETDNKTKAGQLLDGDIWQAGADPGVLLVGVSFADAHFIYMNTIHIAHPAQPDETKIADGLTILTYPIDTGSEKKR